MSQLVTSERKQIVMRGFQMLVIGIMMNIGITIIRFLAFAQFLWIFISREKNVFITELASNFRIWYDKAFVFMLGASEEKPFPWQNI